MSDCFQIIVDTDATEEEAPALAASTVEWLISEGIVESTMTDCILSDDLGYPPGPNHRKAVDDEVPDLWTNGLEVTTGRTVFHTMGVESYVICPGCGERFEPPDEWGEAITEWYDQSGPGNVRCPLCDVERSIVDWQFDPPWGFGYLGFEFWNWPPLKTEFIEEVARRLGHKIVLVEGVL